MYILELPEFKRCLNMVAYVRGSDGLFTWKAYGAYGNLIDQGLTPGTFSEMKAMVEQSVVECIHCGNLVSKLECDDTDVCEDCLYMYMEEEDE